MAFFASNARPVDRPWPTSGSGGNATGSDPSRSLRATQLHFAGQAPEPGRRKAGPLRGKRRFQAWAGGFPGLHSRFPVCTPGRQSFASLEQRPCLAEQACLFPKPGAAPVLSQDTAFYSGSVGCPRPYAHGWVLFTSARARPRVHDGLAIPARQVAASDRSSRAGERGRAALR